MQQRKIRGHKKRYIVLKDNHYHYKRRVPSPVAHLDPRAPTVRFSLKTDNLDLALQRRDIYEQADDAHWASLLSGEDATTAQHAYTAAVSRAEMFGLRFRSWSDLVSTDRPASTRSSGWRRPWRCRRTRLPRRLSSAWSTNRR